VLNPFSTTRRIRGWLRRRHEAARLVSADAEALIRDNRDEAYWEARQRERDVMLPDGTTHQGRTPEHWRHVALSIAKRTGRPVGLDTATRMLARRDRTSPGKSEHSDVDEIKRLTGL